MTISPPWLLAAEEMPAKITAPFLSPFRFWVTRTNERRRRNCYTGALSVCFSEDKWPPPFYTLKTTALNSKSTEKTNKSVRGIVVVTYFKTTLHISYTHTNTHTHTHKIPAWGSRSHERNMTVEPTGKATGKQLTYETARKPVFVYSPFFSICFSVCVCVCGGGIEGSFF